MDPDNFALGQLVRLRPFADGMGTAIAAHCGEGPYLILFIDVIDDPEEEDPVVVWIGPHTIDPSIAARFDPSAYDSDFTHANGIRAVPASYLTHVLN